MMNRYAATTRGNSNTISNPDLLIKNLRLLDLDEEFDWPGIETTTFNAADSVKNLNKRLYSAAWLFYKLFELYDPDKTKRELRDLFPPLESKQSALLRAAVFKRLYDLKLAGFFGKDVVVRKTMFDDCKGPKFEELLAVFSSAVLLLVIERDKNDRSAVSTRINSNTKHLYIPELILAYKVSLTVHLRNREALQRRWAKFTSTLEAQRGLLEQRAQDLKSTAAKTTQKRIPQRTLARLKRVMKENWVGDQDWVDLLLESDQHRPTGQLLETTYPEVWQHACKDALYTIRPRANASRLQILESRLEDQRNRLHRWRMMTSSFLDIQQKQVSPEPVAQTEPEIPTRKYSLRSASSTSTTSAKAVTQKQATSRTLDDISTKKRSPRDLKHRRSRSVVEETPKARAMPSSIATTARKPAANSGLKMPSRLNRSKATQPTPIVNTKRSPAIPETIPVQPESDTGDSNDNISFEDIPNDFSEEESKAADIVNSILNAEASPYKVPDIAPFKAPLTLAERTRISMATMGCRTQASTQQVAQSSQDTPEAIPSTPVSVLGDLAERTRQSMVSKNLKSRPELVRQLSKSRPSVVYPINHFETPRKQVTNQSFFDETIIDLDEADIFKSRPKIAVSPGISPMAEEENTFHGMVSGVRPGVRRRSVDTTVGNGQGNGQGNGAGIETGTETGMMYVQDDDSYEDDFS